MSRTHSLTADGGAVNPLSFKVEECKIETSDGQIVDIKGLLNNVIITESINKMFMEVKLHVLDAANLLELLKLTGGEKLHSLVIDRVGLDGEVDEFRLKDMRIAKIYDFAQQKNSAQTYHILCISEYAYVNQTRVLDHSFKGTMGDIISRICKRELNVTQEMDIETSGDIVKGIFPKLKPLYAVDWLSRNAIDAGTHYYFYETPSGVKFKSYNSLLQEDVHATYLIKPRERNNSDETPGTDGSEFNEEAGIIRKLSSAIDESKYFRLADGCYGSTLHTLDIVNKEYKKEEFRYNKLPMLNDNKPFPEGLSISNKTLNDHVGGRNVYISLNPNAFGTDGNYHLPASTKDIQKKIATSENLKTIQHNFDIAGDFNLECGKLINLEIMKSVNIDPDDEDDDLLDSLLSGVCMVTKIVHRFEKNYVMEVSASRDSYIESLDENIIQVENNNGA